MRSAPLAALSLALLASGCAGGLPGGFAPGPLAAAGPDLVGEPVAIVDDATAARIPWQLTPASTASQAQGEVTHLYQIPGHGLVRATQVAADDIDEPMVPFRRGGGAVARACRAVVVRQAASVGAFRVDSGVAGPRRPTYAGHDATQVFFRIFYRRPGGVTEVRQASLRCAVDHAGRLTSATAV